MMKKLLKKTGRAFVTLSQESERDLRQSVLLVDGSFILPHNFALMIRNVRGKFKNANITVLTFEDKKDFLLNNFPGIEVVAEQNKGGLTKYQLAGRLFALLGRDFKFIVLSSLDISTVFIALLFGRCSIFLHNRWFEWYRIKLRTLSDVLWGVKSADRNRRKIKHGLKDTLKKFGRIFVILSEMKPQDVEPPILVVDNGYTDIGHTTTAARRALESFLNPDITVVTFTSRRHYFGDMFPQAKVIEIKEPHKRYTLALRMIGLSRTKFQRVVLTSLDISPIIATMVFTKAEVFLYNRWHQWWKLELRSASGYLKDILNFLPALCAFVFLLFASGFILLRTKFRLALMKLREQRNQKDGRRYPRS